MAAIPWLPAHTTDNGATDDSLAETRRRPAQSVCDPVLLLILAYLISTGSCLARFVSWFGS